ncbi:hypothetical protein HW115_13920 [Verrucomicrobiaceae bacterium N1E253]|uniref:Uncharacterized protein n=1 Tax=Oceaniferula marina TaxID=2748318 RepID=A0A851GH79_9BACT|nr:hypothetical protein [Oceaniferula marina]NWK56716.1 hypothetical protein [Oceaniferula marina]
MSEQDPPQSPEKTPLPDLQQSVLDPETLSQLFSDLSELTEVLEVIPKAAAQGYVPECGTLTLEEGRALLLSGRVRGLQIRYQYQGSQWWDTLLPDAQSGGFRIVRIQHDFA